MVISVLVTCLLINSVHSIIFPNDDDTHNNCLHHWDDKVEFCSNVQNCEWHRNTQSATCYDHCGDQAMCCSLEIDHQTALPYRDHPAQVLVGELKLLENKKEINWKCGGALIAPKFVLTSAHCLPDEDDVTYVRLTRFNPHGHTIQQKYVFAEKTHIHPKFHSKTPFYFDLALLQLQEALWSFKPVFLPTKESSYKFNNQKLFLMGWSKMHENFNFTKSNMEIVQQRKCSSYFQLPDLKHGIIDNQICGKIPNGSPLAPCAGAKLGPLITDDNVIVGIPSFTFGCNNERPLVFTKITFFTPWIWELMESSWVDHCGFPQRR